MDSPIGKIVAIDAAIATVEVARSLRCARCASGRGCGAGLAGGSGRPSVLKVPLPADSDLREGDNVRLVLAGPRLLRAAGLVYGLPLSGMLLALAAGWLLGHPLADAAAVLLACAGLAAGAVLSRRRLCREDCLRQFVPVIEGRVHGAA